jgi:branched-chain amino acid transport system substrate-binding protein
VPPKGVIAARELISGENRRLVRRHRLAGGAGDLAGRQQGEAALHGRWAAGTGIPRNGTDPNFVFRVSAVDVLVDVKLLDYASKKFGAKKPGLVLVNNPWGASNEKGLVDADKDNTALEIAGIEKFENADVDMTPQLTRLKEKGADSLILVGNAAPGAQLMKSRERMLDGAGRVALGLSGGLPGAGRTDGQRCALRADLQLLRQTERGRPARWRRS